MQDNYKIVEDFINQKNIKYYKNHPFKYFNNFNIGGNIALYISVKSLDDFLYITNFLYEKVIDYFVAVDTSKVIVSDNGYDGIILSLEGEFEFFEFSDDGVLLANCAVALERLSHEARIRNLSGLEFVALLGNKIGAAIYDKFESFDSSILDHIISIKIFNKKYCRIEDMSVDEYLRLNEKDRRFIVILSAILQLKNDISESIDNKIDFFKYIRGTIYPTERNIGPVFEDFYNIKAYEMVERIGGLNMKFGSMIWHKRFPNYIVNEYIYDNDNEDFKAEDVINLIEDTRKKIEQHYGFNPSVNITLLS